VLTYLRIKNLALVEELVLEPSGGCNIVTGETGAGKSVLMGAIGLALGLRADKGFIRTGAESAMVEATFTFLKEKDVTSCWIPTFLEDKGIEPCEVDELSGALYLRIKRTLQKNGQGKQFVNNSAVSVSVLSELGDKLVDIHGPNEHQTLLYSSKQLEILDSFCAATSLEYKELQNKYNQTYLKLRELNEKRADLIVDEQTYRQQLDLLRYQVEEIDSASLNEEADENLPERYQRAAGAADIIQLMQSGIEILSGAEDSMLNQSGALGRILYELKGIDEEQAGIFMEQLESINSSIKELGDQFSAYADGIDLDAEELNQMDERMRVLTGLKRKYGRTIHEVIEFGENARQKLEALESRDADLEKLNLAIQKEVKNLFDIGGRISKVRKELIPSLEQTVSGYLSELGFNQSYFEIAVNPLDQTDWQKLTAGLESVEFLFAPNPGEPPRSLKGIASSGEMARVMLALKTALADVDEVPVLVFDEIDANIGGETARTVGRLMRKIGEKRQTFCITHLAPVAASGDTHYRVQKQVIEDKTVVSVSVLFGEERVQEIARMLGGETDTSMEYARSLLNPFEKRTLHEEDLGADDLLHLL